MLQTPIWDSGRAGDRNYLKPREGAAVAMHYHLAATRSAGETLSVARRVYRPVVKDPAVWGVSKPMAGPRTRRHFVPSAQETNEANRRRFGRRTRPDRDAGEVATSIKGA